MFITIITAGIHIADMVIIAHTVGVMGMVDITLTMVLALDMVDIILITVMAMVMEDIIQIMGMVITVTTVITEICLTVMEGEAASTPATIAQTHP